MTAPDPAGRRLARRLAVQLGAMLLVLLAVVGVTAVWLYESAEHDAADRTLRELTADPLVDDPPPGSWTVFEGPGGRTASPTLPDGLPLESAIAEVAADGRARQAEVELDGRTLFVRTERHGDTVVQAALDRTAAEEAGGRVAAAVLGAGLFGVLLVTVAAGVLAGRGVAPVTEALAMQRRFVRDAGHELRTPLTLLSTRVQLLARDLGQGRELDDRTRADLDGVVADAHALTELLEDLLLAADPAALRQRVPCDLADLVTSAVASAQAAATQGGVELLLSRADPVVVEVAEAAVRRAVTALLDNALDHARSTVTVELGAHAGEVQLSVADDGPGVPPELRDRVFERFATVRPPTEGAGRRHYGLGLALVAEVASAHGGRVTVRRRPDGAPGAVLVLALPA